MTTEEAKQLLLLYRPRSAQPPDRELEKALELARHDPDLKVWFERHCQLQATLQAAFRALPAPGHLKESILAGRKIVRPAFRWHKPAWLAAAALIALLVAVGALWMRPASTERFGLYRARMVRVALHEYKMDILTNDLAQVRQYLQGRGGPSNFDVPGPIQQLKVTGGGHIRWGKAPASMVCFDRGGGEMLFLFVINAADIKGEPPQPAAEKIGELQTLSWTDGQHAYVLAGPDDPEFASKYHPGLSN